MGTKKPSILVVDDDSALCEILCRMLELHGDYVTRMAHTGKSALETVAQSPIDIVFLDLKLPDCTGIEVLRKLLKKHPYLQVIMISGEGTIRLAMDAIHMGAYDFLEKPLDSERVFLTLHKALERSQWFRQKAYFLESFRQQYALVGESPKMQKVYELIQKASMTNSKVLIEGENGTGKELVARAIHHNSPKAGTVFVAVNCAAIPDMLIESELFGHKKGAFTGAIADKQGKIQLADGGTLFLDEVGDMSLSTQAKVLRVLEEGVIEPVGSTEPIFVEVRVIAATNKNLQKEIQLGRFREDLFFRLNVLNIQVPPLRERKEDIPLLVEHFIQRFCQEYGVKPKQLRNEALAILMEHSWPGNVRELKNLVERLVVLVDSSEIYPHHVEKCLRWETQFSVSEWNDLSFEKAKQAFEKAFLREKLIAAQWNVSRAAEMIGISRAYLHRRMKKLGLFPPGG